MRIGLKETLAAATLLAGLAGFPAAVPDSVSAAQELDLDLCAPDQNSFTLNINNPYFPMAVGGEWVLTGVDEGEAKGLRIKVLNATEDLYSSADKVTTRVVQEVEWLDPDADGVVDAGEALVEVSQNYYAQTADGTLCYFGEEVDIYENGIIVSHEGAWRADDAGNAPGIFMPAAPKPGVKFQQEAAPGIAEDEATIIGGPAVTVPAGTFQQTLRVREYNPLDGGIGYKTYAAGAGLLRDGSLSLISY